MDTPTTKKDEICAGAVAATTTYAPKQKKIKKRENVLIKTNIYRERHGINLRFSNPKHKNFFDANKLHRICRSNQSTLDSRFASSIGTNNSEYNLYRKCLNDKSKDFYDQKMEKQKDVKPVDIIAKNREAANDGLCGYTIVKKRNT